MLEERRKYERFPLSLVIQRESEKGIASKITILELSINGCFVEWIDDARVGESFRLKIPLLRGSCLPVASKIIYRLNNTGIGFKFIDLTKFEKDLLAEVIRFNMWKKGFYNVDPYAVEAGRYNGQPEKQKPNLIDAPEKNFR